MLMIFIVLPNFAFSSRFVTPQVTRKIVHAMNEFIGQGKHLITEITTPDFF